MFVKYHHGTMIGLILSIKLITIEMSGHKLLTEVSEPETMRFIVYESEISEQQSETIYVHELIVSGYELALPKVILFNDFEYLIVYGVLMPIHTCIYSGHSVTTSPPVSFTT